MDENLQNIESLFHKALDDNEELPSASVWEAVDKNLDKENIITIRHKYRRLKRTAVFLLLLLVGFSIYEITKINISANRVKAASLPNEVNKSVKNENDAAAVTNIGTHAERNKFDAAIKQGLSIDSDNGKAKSNQPAENNPVAKLDQVEENNPGAKLNQGEENTGWQEIKAKDKFSQQSVRGKKKSRHVGFNAKHKITITGSEAQEEVDQNTGLARNEMTVDYSSLLGKIEDPVYPGRKVNEKRDLKIIPPSIDLMSKTSILVARLAGKTKLKSNKGHFYITGFFSPEIVRQPDQERMEVNTGGMGANLEKAEKHKLSYAFGFFGEYRVNKHWGIQLGVNQSKMNISNEPKLVFAQTDNSGNIKYFIHTSSGYGYFLPSFSSNPAIGDSLSTSVTNQSLTYVGIPLALSYTATKRRFEIHAMAGIEANILTRAKLQTTVTKNNISSMESINNLQGLEKLYYNGMAGIGIGYSLTKKISLVLDPAFRFALSSINEEQRLKSYPISIGFATGIRFRL